MAEYFYNSNGAKVNLSDITREGQEYKGTTRDGNAIYHTAYFDTRRRKHVSYDTVVVSGEHQYIIGSGHETDHDSGSKERWDWGNRVTWQDALNKYTRDLIKTW